MTAVTTQTLPQLAGFTTYYGIPLCDIGDDGDVVLLGHHDKRTAIAALNRHARQFWGCVDLYDGSGPITTAVDDITVGWAVLLLDRCFTADQPEHEDTCTTCSEIKHHDWWIHRDGVQENTPDAFPVMYWSC